MARNVSRYWAIGLLAFTAVVAVDAALTEHTAAPCPMRVELAPEAFPEPGLLTGYGRVQAIPAFARKFNVTCTTCHTAFPYLNAFGRSFKRNGYRVEDEDGLIDPDMQNRRTISPNLTVDEVLPIALGIEGALLNLHGVEDGDDTTTLAPFGQLELIGAGNFAWWGSYYAIISAEMEDEPQAFVTAHGMLGLHPSRYFNVIGGHADPFHHDPYNSLSPHRLGALHEHHDQSQFISGYGYAGPLYYMLGISAGGMGDVDEELLGHGRLAVELTENFEVGTFGSVGSKTTSYMQEFELVFLEPVIAALGDHHGVDTEAAVERDYVRVGADMNLSAGAFHFLALGTYKQLSEDHFDIGELGGAAEFLYLWTQEERALLAPMMRVDAFRNLDDDTSKVRLTANLSSYVVANARAGIEYGVDAIKPDEVSRTQDLTLFFKAYW